jgi:hypothetical protein
MFFIVAVLPLSAVIETVGEQGSTIESENGECLPDW